ncbi:MAG: PH domain-containing protein [Eggerthellaceae bacterium]|nr:PH domain-containing protein [Eggerthellaceae bacterium]
MKPLPANQLDPRVKSVWRFNDAIWICIVMLPLIACAFVMTFFPESLGIGRLLLIVLLVLWVVLLVIWLVVLPPIRYARWRYEITPEYLDIAKGIFWRKRYIIPFIRVQNTDTRQGPILRMFGLASVTVSTAAHEHEIPGLDAAIAEELRDRAAELARIAREDV